MPTHTGNPYVNAGAIATTSLISGKDANEKWNKILDFYSRAAGEKLSLIDEVYKSEAATNTGNKALSMLLAKYDRIYADPFESVDIYTKQCSVGVNATQLARMGATLANNGINPATGEQVIKAEDVPYILSTMTMAGLYDGSGGWAWHVGLPAKSGVGGGIVAIVPGKGAIAVFAPPLDEAGNSVKAQEVIEYVTQQAELQPLFASVSRVEVSSRSSVERATVDKWLVGIRSFIRRLEPQCDEMSLDLKTCAECTESKIMTRRTWIVTSRACVSCCLRLRYFLTISANAQATTPVDNQYSNGRSNTTEVLQEN